MIYITEEQAQQIEEALDKFMSHPCSAHSKALATIRAARAQAGHSGEATEMVQEPVAWMTRNVPVTPNWKSTVNSSETALYCKPLYAAPVPITTPDVCGEVCARAKLCYGCNKDLEEANAKYAEQAKHEPVAEVVLRNQSVGFGRTEERKDIQFLADVEVGTKLYAAPVEPVKQEPGAYVYEKHIDGFGTRKDVAFLKRVAIGTKLYTAPVMTKDLTDGEKFALCTELNLSKRQVDAVIAAFKEINK